MFQIKHTAVQRQVYFTSLMIWVLSCMTVWMTPLFIILFMSGLQVQMMLWFVKRTKRNGKRKADKSVVAFRTFIAFYWYYIISFRNLLVFFHGLYSKLALFSGLLFNLWWDINSQSDQGETITNLESCPCLSVLGMTILVIAIRAGFSVENAFIAYFTVPMKKLLIIFLWKIDLNPYTSFHRSFKMLFPSHLLPPTFCFWKIYIIRTWASILSVWFSF